MISPDEQPARRAPRPAAPKSALVRYLYAFVASLAGLLVTTVLFEFQVSAQPIYAPLIAIVVLTTWYGGLGPAAFAIVVCWGAALGLLVEPKGEFPFSDAEDMVRWWINLAVAVVVAGVGTVLRTRERESSGEALSARLALQEIESLQQLSVVLAGALSSSDVAGAISSHAPAIVSADGVALGIVQGEELAIIGAAGIASGFPDDGRLALHDATLLTRAARMGAPAFAGDRAALHAAYADSASLLPESVSAAIAVPLRAGGDVIGSLGFLFERGSALDDEARALARIVADLAAQALERARLYEVEQESRRSLDRILAIAPRFLADDPGDVPTIICREARTTFGADQAVLWRIDGDELSLLAYDPPRSDLDGTRLALDDFPRLQEAIESLGASFVADALESTYGAGLDFVRHLGVRSSLRTPVVISGVSELVLSISWLAVVSEPDPATIAVVRRFADQAGLALEQVERRRAQDEAAARADATRRLQDVTAALSQAATSLDVSNTCLERALASIGAEAGYVVLVGPDGTRSVELVTTTGYDDEELDAWRAVDLDADVPFAKAVATGEPVWALTEEEMSTFADAIEPRTSGWVTLPLVTRQGVRGAVHLSLRGRRTLTAGEREWLQALVAQCGQALERSSLYEDEQRSRQRAERLQGITALLSNALTPADVANVVAEQVAAFVDTTSIAVAAVQRGEVTGVLAAQGDGADIVAMLESDLASYSPGVRMLRGRPSVLLDAADSAGSSSNELQEALARAGSKTVLLVPLVAGRRTNGLLLAAWDESTRLTADDRGIVEALAGQAALALDRARQFESEQLVAETLQRSVLPVSLPHVDGVKMAARYLPGSEQLDVGGDWFDALQLPDGKLGLVVGDVVGKGVEAAASMSQLRNAIRAFSLERLKPPSVLARLNRLANEVLDTSFATVAYLVLDPASGDCRLSSAGHPPPVVAYPDGRIDLLETARGLPLGTGLESKYRQETLEVPAGTVLLLYTDGLVERRGRSIDDGLDDVMRAVCDAPKDPERLLEHILEQVVGSGERGDDIAVLAVRFLPVAPRPLVLRVRSNVQSIEVVRDALRAWLEGAPLDRSGAEDVVLATWEACANAIEHAVDPAEDVVSVCAELASDRVRIRVADTGTWAPASGREDRGFGLRLMGSLSTSVDVSRAAVGTTVTIEKTIVSEHTAGD